MNNQFFINSVMLYYVFLPISILVSVLIGLYFTKVIFSSAIGSGKQVRLWNIIKAASFSYLKEQYIVIWGVAIILFFILLFIFNIQSAIFFLVGVATSSLSGFISMYISVNTNVRTVEGAQTSLSSAFKVALLSGGAASIFLHSIGLLSIAICSICSSSSYAHLNLLCLGIGVSLVSVFARLGGGIFTKGADVGADLVGKTQLELAEDDARNPAVIADNVGDNVGDVAGMSADLCESYVSAIIAAMLIFFPTSASLLSSSRAFLPIGVSILGLFSSIIPLFFLKFKNVWQEINRYFITSVLLFITSVLLLKLSCPFMQYTLNTPDILCIILGAISVFLILKVTQYYTDSNHKPVQDVAQSSSSGAGTNVILGISYGFEAATISLFIIMLCILFSFQFNGIQGIALNVIGSVALSPCILVFDIFGPISDNAGGICEMSGLGSNIRKITDELDAVGNTTKAITKGYSISSALLAAITMFYLFTKDIEKIFGVFAGSTFDNPFMFCGIIIGSLIAVLFAAMSLKSVSKAAYAVVEEVKKQILDNPKILTGEVEPDYNRTVVFLTKFSIKAMIIPSLLPVITPIISFILANFISFDKALVILSSQLIGITIVGSILSILMTVSGGLWDNTKKYIESQGHKGTELHKTAVFADTIGDPFKDTTGPSFNAIIKLSNLIGILIIWAYGKHINGLIKTLI